MSSSSRSAGPSATSSRCRFSKPSVKWATTSGEEMRLFVHLTLVPFIAASGELKTKPTQHSVKELRAIGIQPDILLCRCDRSIPRRSEG